MSTENRVSLRWRIGDFCRARVSTIYPPRDVEALQAYYVNTPLVGLLLRSSET